MPKLYQHQLDDTYYTRLYWPGVSAIVTRQIHPDGVVFLKRQGVQLDGEIPLWLIDTLKERSWLATKEEMPYWGIVDWPKWHLIDAPKPKPFPRENPFVTKKREAARAEKRAAEEEKRRVAEEAERRELEARQEANRDRGRRYRARQKAEAEAARLEAERTDRETEAKRAARRERDRLYRAKKRAEAGASSPNPGTVDSTDRLSPADFDAIPLLTAPPAIGNCPPPVATTMAPVSPTHAAPQQPEARIDPSSRARSSTNPTAERSSRWLFALLVVGCMLLVMAIAQMLDVFPM